MSHEDAVTSADVAEPEREGTKFQFLRSRNVHNTESDYHPTHKEESLAEIPDIVPYGVVVAQSEVDRENATLQPSEYQLTDKDAEYLKQEITHLSFETILQIFEMYHYNVEVTIAAANQMVAPQLMPEPAKAMYVANIPIEREFNPTRKEIYKTFYMADSFRNVVDNKTLVDFYYSEKNKLDGNWHLEHEDEEPMTSEERIELQEKMARSGIKIARRDPSVAMRKKKGKKHRKLQNPMALLSKLSGKTDEADSDTESMASGSSRQEKSGTSSPAIFSPIPPELVGTSSSAFADIEEEMEVDTLEFSMPPLLEKQVEVPAALSAEMPTIAPEVTSPAAIKVEADKTPLDDTASEVKIETPMDIEAPESVDTSPLASPPLIHEHTADNSFSPVRLEASTSPLPRPPTSSMGCSPIHTIIPSPKHASIGIQVGAITSNMACSPLQGGTHAVSTSPMAMSPKAPAHEEKKAETPPPNRSSSLEKAPETPEPKSSSSSSSTTSTSSESSTTPSTTSPIVPVLKERFTFNELKDYARNREAAEAAAAAAAASEAAAASTPSTSEGTSPDKPQRIKKKYRKKTVEELRHGPQKVYSPRVRVPKKFFDS
ncbi:hypothetical protein CAEBREN_04158 [Caenorhabditis brenneri]|uniref:Uncharacterized protein n=1 Tax=Caenorhabditis brenneri TaxID=135651 RepID=G0M9P8_CAEBE|nr:hypothetical protein CAEBREN_04158 [Caenorhabditis brenneri]